MGAGNGLKGNKSLWFHFAPGNHALLQVLRAPTGMHILLHFHHPPAFKDAKIPVTPPDLCHPLKNSVGKKEQEQREAHNKALHMPNVDQCPVIVIKQILCLLTANLQRLGFSTLLVNMRCDLFWLLREGVVEIAASRGLLYRQSQNFYYET